MNSSGCYLKIKLNSMKSIYYKEHIRFNPFRGCDSSIAANPGLCPGLFLLKPFGLFIISFKLAKQSAR